MRKLASVQKITNIRDIIGADKIQAADVLGWHVVIKKGEFKNGDMVVYCEPDSILPKENPNFAFLEGKPIRTKKMRGALSQGIVFPLDVLKDFFEEIFDLPVLNQYKEGDNVTELLGVTKYDPEVARNKHQKKPLIEKPDWVPTTDFTRCQALQEYLKKYKGTKCVATEKLDGSSCSFWLDENNVFHVCSHYKEVFNTNDRFYKTAYKYKPLIENLPKNMVFQGELIGKQIQQNKYKLENGDYRIYLFDILKKENGISHFLNQETFFETCYKHELPVAPVVNFNFVLPDNVDELTEMSKGKSLLCSKTQHEGIVIKSNVYSDDADNFVNGRFSLKVINPDFLLKYKC